MWSKSVETLNPYNALTGEKKKEPQTNADRIRAMNDEDLTEFLWGFDLEEIARESEYHLEKRKITEWLQSPAE